MLAILESPFFRSSRRSCEFFRHVVENAIQGRTDLLKERAIGIEVLGRSASYDTGSDATVRVRANDVRRRLGSYYEQNRSKAGVRIELPPGSYVPQFVWSSMAEAGPETDTLSFSPFGIAQPAIAGVLSMPAETPTPIPSLTLRHLAAPTVLALFICAISIRYQLLGVTPFQLFWSRLLNGRSQLAVVLDERPNRPNSADINEVQAILPLVNLAQAFQVPSEIRASSEIEAGEHDTLLVRVTNAGMESDPRFRLVIRKSLSGLQVVDKQEPAHRWSHAALITFSPGGQSPLLSIAATDTQALRRGVQCVTDRSSFPQALSNALKTMAVTQVLLDERGEPIS